MRVSISQRDFSRSAPEHVRSPVESFKMWRMEQPDGSGVLHYQSGKRGRSWRLRILIGVLTVIAAAGIWRRYGRTAREALQILYWQRQCSTFEPTAGTFAATPGCWTNYRTALPADEPFMGGTQIFLHECVSPHGARLPVALYMRPNVDHSQFCSIDATVVVPGTFSRPPVESRNVVAWVDGWSSAVQWNRLGWAQLDPADASHIIFQYNSPEPKWWGSESADQNDDTMVITPTRLDFWLQDDGRIVDHAPVSSVPPVSAEPKPSDTRDLVFGPPRPTTR
jgi:hypothetical protein